MRTAITRTIAGADCATPEPMFTCCGDGPWRNRRRDPEPAIVDDLSPQTPPGIIRATSPQQAFTPGLSRDISGRTRHRPGLVS